jgi:hypothetical protein
MNKKIRYAGVYSGPSYGNPWAPSYEGFTSLMQAEQRFYARQKTSGAWKLDVTNLVLDDDRQITEVTEDNTYWPATSPEDTLELYDVAKNTVITCEPVVRMTAGPRGGVVRERY